MDRRDRRATVHGVTESDTTEQHTHTLKSMAIKKKMFILLWNQQRRTM